MILNLISSLKSLTKSESSRIENLLSKIQIKGALDGILIELMQQREGIVQVNDSRIRVLLPDGLKKGDKVLVDAEKNGGRLELKIIPKDQQVISTKTAGKEPPESSIQKYAKDQVYHIRIPEKVNLKEVMSNINRELANLKSSGFDTVAGKVEKFIDTQLIKIDDKTSTQELARNIESQMKNSGVFFEEKLRTLSDKPTNSAKPTDSTLLNSIKNDAKQDIYSALNELQALREKLPAKVLTNSSTEKLLANLTKLDSIVSKENPAELTARQLDALKSLVGVIITDIGQTITNAGASRPSDEAMLKVVSFLMTLTAPEVATSVLSRGSETDILNIIKLVESSLSRTTAGSDAKTPPTLKELSDALASLKGSLLAEKSDAKYLPVDQTKSTPEKEALNLKSLKNGIKTLVADIAKESQEAQTRSQATRSVEALVKSFGKLLEGVEYQQLSHHQRAEGSVNYQTLPIMLEDSYKAPEILVTHKKSKKGEKKMGKDESRLEVFLDLKQAGHSKIDLNINAKI